jgi:hypothetical protein
VTSPIKATAPITITPATFNAFWPVDRHGTAASKGLAPASGSRETGVYGSSHRETVVDVVTAMR